VYYLVSSIIWVLQVVQALYGCRVYVLFFSMGAYTGAPLDIAWNLSVQFNVQAL
jgi:hypothetical protein